MESTPPPHAWLVQLADEVSARLIPTGVAAPIGCHYHHNHSHDQWEVTLFAARTETVGGPLDGRISTSKFSVDLDGLAEIFDNVARFQWQALSLGQDDELGPHISVEGIYRGHSVWLRIPAVAPERFEPGRSTNAGNSRIEERW